ncbi:divalent-cation tolerance protein CutA [Nitrospira sp. Kam-Ns4a]
MADLDNEIVVFVTTTSETEALRIARAVVEQELAACANVLPAIRSVFRWEGKVSEEHECLMILKSRAALFDELAAAIKDLHSYSVPEIIAVPIQRGWPDYLRWIHEVTRKPQK